MRMRSETLCEIVLLTCVLLYAGLLRLDALFKYYVRMNARARGAAAGGGAAATTLTRTGAGGVDVPYVGGIR